MPFLHQAVYRLGIGVVAVSENVILPFIIPAGKFRSRNKVRIVLLQDFPENQTALDRVMVRQGKKPDAGFLYQGEDLFRGISPVRNRRMDMKVYFFQIVHYVSLVLA